MTEQVAPVRPAAFLVPVEDRLVGRDAVPTGRVSDSSYTLSSRSACVVHILQTLEEDEVGHLLDGGDRIGDAAGPEAVPKSVDFRFKLWIGEHYDSIFVEWRSPSLRSGSASSGLRYRPGAATDEKQTRRH